MPRKPDGSFSPAVRMAIHERDWFCLWCGNVFADQEGQAHHRRPRQMGGTSNPEIGLATNGIRLHERCHADVEKNRQEAKYRGFIVPAGYSPANVLVKDWMGRKWRLWENDRTID